MRPQVRETSLETYNYIMESGLLSKRLRKAYGVFYLHGPLTGQELNSRMEGDGAWKLCSPLKEMGVLQEVEKRRCKVTGRMAFAWDVTANIPMKPAKRKTKDDIIRELRAELRALKRELADYKARNLPKRLPLPKKDPYEVLEKKGQERLF